MRSVLGGLVLASLGLVACASSGATKRIHQPGDATGQPSVEALPSLDVDAEQLTAEMRMARLLSAEALNLTPPERPHDLSSRSIDQWSEHELKVWLGRKQQSADAARVELDRAAVQSQRQRIMAGALVGLVYEDVARSMLSLPVPAELASEPEIAAMYGDVVRSQAAPYLLVSRQAYTACAGNAEQLQTLNHWADFCTSREERLPASGLEPSEQGAGKTTVQVVRR